jgi:hypothetical protein
VRKSVANCVLLLSVTLLATNMLGQGAKVDAMESLSESAVPESVRKILNAKGYRITIDDGSVACDLWLRSEIPTQAKKDVAGALYPQLAESTLVGVISFPQATTDYRGQAVKAGFYTLRYELIPDDGNHLGVAPNRDFLLLVPAASDTNPTAVLTFDDLVQMSRGTTGTKHPAPLSLTQAGSGTAPAIAKDEEEHWIFSAGLKMATGDSIPIALVVKGTAPQ